MHCSKIELFSQYPPSIIYKNRILLRHYSLLLITFQKFDRRCFSEEIRVNSEEVKNRAVACSIFWRRRRDSNPRAFWANGFQDRLVMTTSILLRVRKCRFLVKTKRVYYNYTKSKPKNQAFGLIFSFFYCGAHLLNRQNIVIFTFLGHAARKPYR